MEIVETERLFIREMDSDIDAEFIFELLNTPKFIKYIGDRGVRSVDEAHHFIESRYRRSYREHGYGLYTVQLKSTDVDRPSIGICGFVKRSTFEFPDIGFAFLPDFEGKGFGHEAAEAVLKFGRDRFGFSRVLAITSPDNIASGRLLNKIGFEFDSMVQMPEGEELKLFSLTL